MSYWQGKIQIRNRLYSRFIGGPLDGITDSPFRQIVRQFSPDNLQYTEMRHVASVAHPKGGQKALVFEQMERPVNYQVAANELTYIAPACEKILAAGVDAVDLNVGCPAKNVVRSGGGSSLMANPGKLKEILLELRRCLPDVAFTVKIRAGYKECNAVEIAQLAQDCGVDALAIHPRLQTEMFLGQPNYNLAAQVKAAVQIPVIFSGNVVNWKMAKMTYERTGVDGFLIGRGIWGRPWKLQELDRQSVGESFVEPDQLQIMQIALQHFELMLQHYGPAGVCNFRKHLPFYLRGFTDALALRKQLMTTPEAEKVRAGLQVVLEQFKGNSHVEQV